jgi:DNA-directed RNA polymerase subunit RPC12/RpoP
MKIIKHGNMFHRVRCPHCNALLEFSNRDTDEFLNENDGHKISKTILCCPDCDHEILVKYKIDDELQPIEGLMEE